MYGFSPPQETATSDEQEMLQIFAFIGKSIADNKLT
jgi:hypothetical protein